MASAVSGGALAPEPGHPGAMPFQRRSTANASGMTHRHRWVPCSKRKEPVLELPDRPFVFIGGLLAQAELVDERRVALRILVLQVRQQALAGVDHLQQAAAAMMVLQVGLEVRRELVDAGGEEGHLHFRRAGVVGAARVGLDDLGLVDVRHLRFLCGGCRAPEGWTQRFPVLNLRSPVKPTSAVLTRHFESAKPVDYKPRARIAPASRSTPAVRRAGSREAKHQRSQPSPSGPNAAPGASPSPCSATRRFASASESSWPSTRKNTYMPPGGGATVTPGSAARRGTSVSRQSRSRCTRRGTKSPACASAARPARCTNTGAHEVLNSISLPSASTIAGGATIQPSRQPVIRKLL